MSRSTSTSPRHGGDHRSRYLGAGRDIPAALEGIVERIIRSQLTSATQH